MSDEFWKVNPGSGSCNGTPIILHHEVNVAARGRVDNVEIIKGKLPSISEPGI